MFHRGMLYRALHHILLICWRDLLHSNDLSVDSIEICTQLIVDLTVDAAENLVFLDPVFIREVLPLVIHLEKSEYYVVC